MIIHDTTTNSVQADTQRMVSQCPSFKILSDNSILFVLHENKMQYVGHIISSVGYIISTVDAKSIIGIAHVATNLDNTRY